MEETLLRRRFSSSGVPGQTTSRTSISAHWSNLEWPPSSPSPGVGGKTEVMFQVLFREFDLIFRMVLATCFVAWFAYVGANKLATLAAVYVLFLLVSAYCYFRNRVFASSAVLCVSTTAIDLIAVATTGGLHSCLLFVLPMCSSLTVYCMGPKCGLATAVLILPCVFAMLYIPPEWNELETCLSTYYCEEKKSNILACIRFILMTVCGAMHAMLMVALMTNLREGYETRLKSRLEAQAVEEAQRFRADFVASISHELRTPMNAICGACETLLNECKSTDDTEWITLIDDSARTLLALVNDIISVVATQQYASPGRKRIEMQSIPCDFPSLIKDVIRTARLSSKPGVDVKLLVIDPSAQQVCDDSSQMLLGDPDRFRQIVTHLVSNAIKFTKKGSVRVTLSCRPTSPEGSMNRVLLLVAVSDTGIGIPSDKLSEIFEPFAQLDGTATRRYGGTGIGLTISRNLAEIMKGSITVSSEEGKGSRFLFSCPVLVDKNIILLDDDNSHKSTCSSSSFASASSSSSSIGGGGGSSSSSYSSMFSDVSCRSRLSLSSCSSGSFKEITYSPSDSPGSHASQPELDLSFCSGSGTEDKIVLSDGFLVSPPTRQYSPPTSGTNSPTDSTSSETSVSKSVSESGKESGDTSGASISPANKRNRNDVDIYSGQMVIVVDDTLVNVRVLSNHLRRLGLTVETAENGEEAVAVARKHGARASCIFMDIMMPVMDGLQATREIRRLGNEDPNLHFLKDLPIYACTTLDAREEFLQAGMNGALLKPVSFADIQNVFREIIAKTFPLATT